MGGMDGDLTGGGPRMDEGLSGQEILRYISAGAGLVMLLGGLYLGFIAFMEVRSLLRDPSSLKRWALLRDVVHPPDKKVKASPAPTPKPVAPARKNPHEEIQSGMRVLGGYALLFLGLMFTWLLAKIAGMFVMQGTNILMRFTGKK